jgi:hypothetical protein
MDIGNIVSWTSTKCCFKLWQYVTCAKMKIHEWIVSLYCSHIICYFCTDHVLSYFETTFCRYSTYDITNVHDLFSHFFKIWKWDMRNGVRPQLVANLSFHNLPNTWTIIFKPWFFMKHEYIFPNPQTLFLTHE